jgi:hypothetical protein
MVVSRKYTTFYLVRNPNTFGEMINIQKILQFILIKKRKRSLIYCFLLSTFEWPKKNQLLLLWMWIKFLFNFQFEICDIIHSIRDHIKMWTDDYLESHEESQSKSNSFEKLFVVIKWSSYSKSWSLTLFESIIKSQKNITKAEFSNFKSQSKEFSKKKTKEIENHIVNLIKTCDKNSIVHKDNQNQIESWTKLLKQMIQK